MRRRQLIEIEDESWCPKSIRDGLTDYLQFVVDRGDAYAAAAPLLDDALRRTRSTRIVDLGSGGGGPWRRLVGRLTTSPNVTLTDLRPNTGAFARIERETNGKVCGATRGVSADAVPDDLAGFRTIFTAFHHFPPPLAQRVLADAVMRGEGIAVFESTTRDAKTLGVMLLVPLMVWLTTPLLRPFRWSRLLLTYVLPAIPFVAFFDGVVSALRTYTPDELRALAAAADSDASYTWTAGHAGRGPIPLTYLIGVPNAASREPDARSLPA